jgi:DNA-binding MarR family transcriptional regulator
MALEEEINQQIFESEEQKAVINIIYTYHWVTERVKNLLSVEDITHQQFNILRILRGSYPQPLSTLSIRERMLDKMSDTSRIVDRMVRKGLVNKRVCSIDKRLVDVSITNEGKKMLDRLDKKMCLMKSIAEGLNQDELKALNLLLDKLRSAH